MKAVIWLVIVALVFGASPCHAYTEDRNLGNIGEVFMEDLRELLSAEGLASEWVGFVDRALPTAWVLLLVGGPIALTVVPKKTLQKYMVPAPLVPKSLVNPQDAERLNAFAKKLNKHLGTWGRVVRLFRR